MARFNQFLLLAALLLLSWSCEKDNFDTTEEIAEEITPEVVEFEEEYFISYKMPSGAKVTQSGVGLLNKDQGFVGLATSETATAECLEGGVISLSTDGSGLILAFTTDPLALFIVGAFDVEGAPEANAFQNPACASVSPVLELTTLTDEQAAGTLSVELFTLNHDSPNPSTCDGVISLGVFDIEFNVALDICN